MLLSATLVPFVLAQLLPLALASIGDTSPDYRYCLTQCVQQSCGGDGDRSDVLPWHLRLFLWRCEDDCRYQCMHYVTTKDVSTGRRVRQFYGKWPFVRLLGIQEPASVCFSFLNLLSHLYGFYGYLSCVPVDSPRYWIICLCPLAAANTWLWSIVFHTRDTMVTERLDYFSGTLLVAYMMIYQFVRITGPTARVWQVIYACCILLLYATHVSYLSLVHFDYGYNMAVNVIAGAVCTCIWMAWSLWHIRRRPYIWKCIVSILGPPLFISLELLDFPPFMWTFDAHSIWHLSTTPLPLLWYSFLLDDSLFGRTKTRKTI